MLPYATGQKGEYHSQIHGTVVTTLGDGYFLVSCVTMRPLPMSDPTDLLIIFYYALDINWTVQSFSA